MNKQPQITWRTPPGDWHLFFAGDGPISARREHERYQVQLPSSSVLADAGLRPLTDVEILARSFQPPEGGPEFFRPLIVIKTPAMNTDTRDTLNYPQLSHWDRLLALLGFTDELHSPGEMWLKPEQPYILLQARRIHIYEAWVSVSPQIWLTPVEDPFWYMRIGLDQKSPLLRAYK